MSIREFIAEVKTRGLARTNRYLVEMPIAESELAALLCESASLPGISYASSQQKIAGESREMPYERMFDPITLTFYSDQDMIIKSMFDLWMGSIMDPRTRTFNFYNNYIKDIKIHVLDMQEEKRYTAVLYECYPKTITPVSLSSSDRDVMKFSVTLQYKYWMPEVAPKSRPPTTADGLDFPSAPSTPRPLFPPLATNLVNMEDPQGIFTGTGFQGFSFDLLSGINGIANAVNPTNILMNSGIMSTISGTIGGVQSTIGAVLNTTGTIKGMIGTATNIKRSLF